MPIAIHLKANNNQYVCAEGGGGQAVVANRIQALQWETFALIDPNGGQLISGDAVMLRVYNGKYVCAEGGGGQEVVANRDIPNIWETFTLMHADQSSGQIMDSQQIVLRAYNGQYVRAENGGGREVVASSNGIGPWETFTIELLGSAPMLEFGEDRGTLGRGQHITTKVVFSNTGRVDVENHIWTNNEGFGFTGGAVVFLLDAGLNVLASTPMWTYGVNGTWIPGAPSSRTQLEYVDLGLDVFARTALIDIRHALTPRSRLIEDINTGVEIGKSIAQVVADIVALSG